MTASHFCTLLFSIFSMSELMNYEQEIIIRTYLKIGTFQGITSSVSVFTLKNKIYNKVYHGMRGFDTGSCCLKIQSFIFLHLNIRVTLRLTATPGYLVSIRLLNNL